MRDKTVELIATMVAVGVLILGKVLILLALAAGVFFLFKWIVL